jgi:hypothetical protein
MPGFTSSRGKRRAVAAGATAPVDEACWADAGAGDKSASAKDKLKTASIILFIKLPLETSKGKTFPSRQKVSAWPVARLGDQGGNEVSLPP